MLFVDEFPNVFTRDEAAAQHMLSQTRKYGLHLVLAHQNWTQASERLRGALQNVKVEVSFALGRDDAERSAKILGRVDTERVKHDAQTAQQHPLYDPLAEQWERFTQALVDQQAGRAMLRLPGDRRHRWEFWKSGTARTLAVRTLRVPSPSAGPDGLLWIEERYLRRYFRSQAEVTQALAAQAPAGESLAPPGPARLHR